MNKASPSLTIMMKALKIEAENEYSAYRLRNDLDGFDRKWGELKKILD